MRIATLVQLVLLFSVGALPATVGGFSVGTQRVEQKLASIVIDEVELENVGLAVAIDLLRAKGREADRSDIDGEEKGLRIGFDRPRRDEVGKLVTLSMVDVPIGEVLAEIGRQTERRLEVFGDGVVLRRLNEPLAFEGLFVRSYRVPPDFAGSTAAPGDDPFAPGKRPNAEGLDPERKGPTLQSILESHGITFPEGASAVFNRRNSTLTMRNTRQNHELLEALIDEGGGNYVPNFVRVRLEVYTLDAALALQLARRSAFDLGGRVIWEDVREALAKGEAELDASQELVTRSGQRAKLETGWGYRFIEGYEFKDGVARPEFDSVFVGKSLELDPVVGADGQTIELNMAVSISEGEPKIHRREIRSPLDGKPLDFEVVELDAMTLTTALTTRSGVPMFIGILRSGEGDWRAQIGFVTASVAAAEQPLLPE